MGGREGGEKRRKKPRFTMDKGDAREMARWLLSSRPGLGFSNASINLSKTMCINYLEDINLKYFLGYHEFKTHQEIHESTDFFL